MEVFTNISFNFDLDKFYEKANIDDEKLKKEADEYLSKIITKIQPKAIYKESYIDKKVDNEVIIENTGFKSNILKNNLENIERVFPFIATGGHELEEIQNNTSDYLKQFWIDKLKEMSLAAATSYLYNHITDKYKIDKISSMNPGSADKEVWPIEQQQELFSLFGDIEELIGVKLTESSLMIPNKSVSGIYFPSDETFINCEYCTREVCPSRRAPYNPEKW
mgnify:CR=1 FL=1